MIYKLPLVFEKQPEGGYTVTCPILPELITEGETIPEALENVTDCAPWVAKNFRAATAHIAAGFWRPAPVSH
jgi:hypothetical protein